MTRYIAFLRATNVGGHIVSMAELRRHFESLGYDRVETFIASGNVVFDAPKGTPASHETRIEKHLLDVLGYEVKTFLRSLPEVNAVAEQRPFSEKEHAAASAFCVGFLKRPLDVTATKSLAEFASDIDVFRAVGREVYWLCKKKQSESNFSGAVFERRLKLPVTFRGMNTVQRIAAKYAQG